MRNPLLSRGALILSAACLICFCVALPSHEQGARSQRVSVLTDWTTRHVLYPLYGQADRMQKAGRDPRSLFSWYRYSPNAPRWNPRGRVPHSLRRPSVPSFDRDWSINLGLGGVAPNMFPTKFSFDVTAAPSCANDYAVFPINAAGSATQANIVAFNNLYSGTAGGAGVCNRTPVANDDGVDATVYWSYNVSAIGGAVTTSPTLSWDYTGVAGSVLGTKVAFVESAVGQPAHFHVLAFKAGDGQDTTDPSGLQNTMKPVQITTGSFVLTEPAAGSGTATDLTFGVDSGASDTISPPFVDYSNDYAYVGDDEGNLYRIKDVFCPTFNTDAGCTAHSAPILDPAWGTAGVVVVGSHCGQLSGPVEDFATGNVFVGCSDGFLYGFNSTGTPLPTGGGSLFLGVGSANAPGGGIVTPPIVDSSKGFVYAVTGTNGTNAALLQAKTSLASARRVGLGGAPGEDISLPAFNTAYFSSSTTSSWGLLACGYDTSGTHTVLYIVSFNASEQIPVIALPASNQFQLASDVEACAPLTNFENVNVGPPFPPTDWLFAGLSGGSLFNFNLNGSTGSGFAGGFTNIDSFTVAGGPSGTIPDNESADPQASSIYFGSLLTQPCGTTGTGYCAVKLTQAGLE